MDLDANKMYDPEIDGPQYDYSVDYEYDIYNDECCAKAAEEKDIEAAIKICHTCHIDDKIDEYFVYEFHECTRKFDKKTDCYLSGHQWWGGYEDNYALGDTQYFLEEKLQPSACCEAKMNGKKGIGLEDACREITSIDLV